MRRKFASIVAKFDILSDLPRPIEVKFLTTDTWAGDIAAEPIDEVLHKSADPDDRLFNDGPPINDVFALS